MRPFPIRKFGKRAGAVVLALVALDVVATVVMLALGASWLNR